MASSRKKQDEKNLKLLRDLASLPHNKYCFDCNQRGPTYVNVTIGSFVCTKCSGMLRGLTPPHRVKSISMASFTTEEVDLLKARGNNYCRSTWLGLYEGNAVSNKEEQDVHNFMIDKYELKRYFLENPAPLTNGITNSNSQTANKTQEVKLKNNFVAQPKLSQVNGTVRDRNNKNINGQIFDFVADFGSADIYNASSTVKDNKFNNNSDTQMAFANFDNQIFNINNSASILNNVTASNNIITSNSVISSNGPPAPSEDRYAALKDLDNAFKGQTQLDWSSTSNSSYGSTTPSSVYSSPSPQNVMFNSPSQDQFLSQFGQQELPKISNPFNGSMMWTDASNQQNNLTSNPFRTTTPKSNGISTGLYGSPFSANNGSLWTPNPFMMGSSMSSEHSSNPFL
ncbi:hypothetical protein FQA39_LY12000 [Lamprigera yunnana]|nr:hypothetical protein FQA39_LY12000 [Lamprigera yunnana]